MNVIADLPNDSHEQIEEDPIFGRVIKMAQLTLAKHGKEHPQSLVTIVYSSTNPEEGYSVESQVSPVEGIQYTITKWGPKKDDTAVRHAEATLTFGITHGEVIFIADKERVADLIQQVEKPIIDPSQNFQHASDRPDSVDFRAPVSKYSDPAKTALAAFATQALTAIGANPVDPTPRWHIQTVIPNPKPPSA